MCPDSAMMVASMSMCLAMSDVRRGNLSVLQFGILPRTHFLEPLHLPAEWRSCPADRM